MRSSETSQLNEGSNGGWKGIGSLVVRSNLPPFEIVLGFKSTLTGLLIGSVNIRGIGNGVRYPPLKRRACN
jgi:hypothetical protein